MTRPRRVNVPSAFGVVTDSVFTLVVPVVAVITAPPIGPVRPDHRAGDQAVAGGQSQDHTGPVLAAGQVDALGVGGESGLGDDEVVDPGRGQAGDA